MSNDWQRFLSQYRFRRITRHFSRPRAFFETGALGGVVAIEAAARSAAVELLSTIYTTLGEKFATLDDWSGRRSRISRRQRRRSALKVRANAASLYSR